MLFDKLQKYQHWAGKTCTLYILWQVSLFVLLFQKYVFLKNVMTHIGIRQWLRQ